MTLWMENLFRGLWTAKSRLEFRMELFLSILSLESMVTLWMENLFRGLWTAKSRLEL